MSDSPTTNDALAPNESPTSPALRLIAGFKFLQGLVLAVVGTGLLILVKKNTNSQVAHWIAALNIDIHNKFIQHLFSKLDATSPLKFKRLSIVVFLYAGVLMIEGTGLLLHKRWAEYLTILVTGSFIPWELFEVVKHFSVATSLVLVSNIAVVGYLVKFVMDKHLTKKV